MSTEQNQFFHGKVFYDQIFFLFYDKMTMFKNIYIFCTSHHAKKKCAHVDLRHFLIQSLLKLLVQLRMFTR